MLKGKIILAFATALLASVGYAEEFQRSKAKEGFSYPEYYCTNRGIRVEVEDSSCLVVGDRYVHAVCDISLNNPMWRTTGETCTPSAEILSAAKDQ